MSESIDVLVADESASVRLLLSSLLRGDERFGEVVAVANGHDVVASCGDVDLVVVDLVLADGEAFSIMEMLREKRPELPVVVYTAAGPPYLRAEASARGAAGYHTHAEEPDAVLDALAKTVERARSG